MQGFFRVLRKLTKADLVLIILILIFSGAGIAAPRFFQPDLDEMDLVVIQGGEVLFRQDFPQEDGYQEFTFEWEEEEYTATLEYDNNRVRLHRLSKDVVPLPIHVDMGWIQRPGQIIAAVPVKLLIRLEGERPDDGLDGVAGSYN